MHVPLSYIFKNLLARRLTTALTAIGMAVVVFVFAVVLMLSVGLERTLVETGSADNVLAISRSVETEVQSKVDREQAALIESSLDIAYGPKGERLLSKEVVVLMTFLKRNGGKPANVTLRGLSGPGLTLRPQVRIFAGKMFRPGTSEIVIGRSVADGFVGTDIGETLRFARRDWTVVGAFDAGNTGFNSEVWVDVDQLMQAFRRKSFSSVLFRLRDPSSVEAVERRIETDQRLGLEAKRESVFYAEQSEVMARFLRTLGMSLSAIFSVGAIIGAMITMYASVVNRTREIATLRALGFGRTNILLAFLVESSCLGLLGSVLGLTLASGMQFFSVSTMNWQTFAELAFSFSLNPEIIAGSLGFGLLMGLVGGVLPATRAARMNIVESLRAG